ncbi:MAG: Phage shock protein [Verrucomicrobiota bacterium]|jgi:phage shock protein A
MGIFTRFRDIVSSNINAMLDAAEDPEKMIRLMIQEMEETLIEMKSACAGTLATQTRLERSLEEARQSVAKWEGNARLALERNRDDLAREALLEKRRHADQLQSLEQELRRSSELVQDHRAQIVELEKKLTSARERQRLLAQRHVQATQKFRAQSQIREFEQSSAVLRFDQFESRIEQMEAAAGLVRPPQTATLEERFVSLKRDEEIEKELQRLRAQTHSTH